MLKIKRTIVHEKRRNETLIELETRVIARHVFRVGNEMDSQAIELQTAVGANMLVGEVLNQANGFELLPIESRITFNEPQEERE